MSVLTLKPETKISVPKEVLERTDPRKGQFSPSSYNNAQCPRKFYLEKILGLKSKYISPPLVYGSAIHNAVEFFYKHMGSPDMTYEEVQMGAIQAFTDYWVKYPVMGDDRRTLAGGITTIARYCDTYRDDITEFEESDIEGTQWVPMPNGTMLMMKLDRIAQQGHSVGVVDTKTTSWGLTDHYFRGYETDMQVSLYYYGMEQLLGQCDFIMIDGILVPHPEPGSTRQGFARRNFFRVDNQMDEAVNTYCKVTDWIMAGMKLEGKEQVDYYHQNPARCNDYGGCPFKSICIHGLDHPAIGTDFLTREQQEQEKEDG
jgi:hypothetical protein